MMVFKLFVTLIDAVGENWKGGGAGRLRKIETRKILLNKDNNIHKAKLYNRKEGQTNIECQNLIIKH